MQKIYERNRAGLWECLLPALATYFVIMIPAVFVFISSLRHAEEQSEKTFAIAVFIMIPLIIAVMTFWSIAISMSKNRYTGIEGSKITVYRGKHFTFDAKDILGYKRTFGFLPKHDMVVFVSKCEFEGKLLEGKRRIILASDINDSEYKMIYDEIKRAKEGSFVEEITNAKDC